MSRLRSFLPFVLALIPVATGCKKDETPTPAPESASSTSASLASGKGRQPLRGPIAPIPKIDPQLMKEYRLEVCYFGTLTLRQARDAYFASLGKDEPNEKKIPNFGYTPPGPTLIPRPGVSAAPTPAPSAAPAAASAKAATSAAPGPSGVTARKFADIGARPAYERNARACTVAAGLKEPAMPDIDAALTAFAPYSLELSRNIGAATIYYQREEYTKDKFEKGKELHKKFVADFAKLDELSDKLGAAIAAHRKDHPVDASKLDEGEKLTLAAYDKARTIVLGLIAKKIDVAAHKENVVALEKAVEALKAYGTNNGTDPWSKITAPSFDAFLKITKDNDAKITEKGVESEAFIPIINTFTNVVEAKHRALSRSLIAKGQTVEPHAGADRARPNLAVPVDSAHQQEEAH